MFAHIDNLLIAVPAFTRLVDISARGISCGPAWMAETFVATSELVKNSTGVAKPPALTISVVLPITRNMTMGTKTTKYSGRRATTWLCRKKLNEDGHIWMYVSCQVPKERR